MPSIPHASAKPPRPQPEGCPTRRSCAILKAPRVAGGAATTPTMVQAGSPSASAKDTVSLPSGELEGLLHRLRHTVMFRQAAAEQADFAYLRSLPATPGQRVEIDALELLYLPPQATELARSQLPRAANLLAQAQVLGQPLAEAAAWRAIYWLQLQLKLFAAALHSIAMAMRSYEQAGDEALVFALSANRCTLLYCAEMFAELRTATSHLLRDAERLETIQRHQILNAAASAAYYLALELEDDCDEQRASSTESDALWAECLTLHRQALQWVEPLNLPVQRAVSRLNLAICSASRGDLTPCQPLLDALQADAGLALPGFDEWTDYCRLLMRCQQDSPDAVWPELQALQQKLTQASAQAPGLCEAQLHLIERFARRWGHDAAALQASRQRLHLRRLQTRELGRALGDTVQEVMEHPRLLYENEALSRRGDALQNSLLERNAELQRALQRLQAEAEVRHAAELGLQRTHDDLERQVQQRSAELEQAMRKLMEQERQLALSRMVAGMAHEMNTPLDTARMAASAIQDNSHELRQRLSAAQLKRQHLQALAESLDEGLALLQRALDRVAQLRQRFASVTQTAQQGAQLIDATELVQAMARGWQALLRPRSVQLQLDLPPRARLLSHADALRQVLQQLLENSLQHGLAGRTDGSLRLSLREAGDAWLLEFGDNGCGIAPEHLNRVFEPFFTTQLGRSGAGLGLTSVHSLVLDLLGGDLQLKSQPGLGTVVQIRLPRTPAEASHHRSSTELKPTP